MADDGSGAAGAQKAFDSLIFQKKVNVLITMETSAARNAGLPIVTSRQDAVHLYLVLRRPLLQQVPVRQRVGAGPAGGADRRLLHEELQGQDLLPDRQRLRLRSRHAGVHRAATSRRRAARCWAKSTCRWTAPTGRAIISKLKAAKPDALITSTAGGAPNVTLTKQLRAAGVKIPYGNLAVDEGTAEEHGPRCGGHLHLRFLLHQHRQPRRTRNSSPPCRRSSAPI